MLDIKDFKSVFRFDNSCSYGQSISSRIHNNRRTLNTELFFDKLLAVLQIEGKQLYPPQSNRDLRELHRRIVSAQISEHHKQSLLFYLLRDFSPFGGHDVADEFAKDCLLPEKYWIFMRGLWEMDGLNFRSAMDYLTRPSLLPTFPEHILGTLLRNTTAKDSDLALVYYLTVSPPLTSPDLRDAYFSYLSRISITDAYNFSRRQPDDAHRNLFELLIHEVLSATPSNQRAANGIELLDLPFDEEEESWFESYLLEGKGRSLHGARDTVMMRRIARGKYAQVLKDGKQLSGRKHDSLSWEVVRDGLGLGLGMRKDIDGFEVQS